MLPGKKRPEQNFDVDEHNAFDVAIGAKSGRTVDRNDEKFPLFSQKTSLGYRV